MIYLYSQTGAPAARCVQSCAPAPPWDLAFGNLLNKTIKIEKTIIKLRSIATVLV